MSAPQDAMLGFVEASVAPTPGGATGVSRRVSTLSGLSWLVRTYASIPGA